MPSAQLNLATLYTMRGDTAQAQRHYRTALAQEPALNVARLSYAQLLVAGHRHDDAARVLRDGLGPSPNPGELHFALGLLAGQRQQWDEAARELTAAARLLPGDARIRRNLDAVLRRLQDARPR